MRLVGVVWEQSMIVLERGTDLEEILSADNGALGVQRPWTAQRLPPIIMVAAEL